MKTGSLAAPLKLVLMLSVVVAIAAGCNDAGGGKNAGDFCTDTCDVFLDCPSCGSPDFVDRENLIPDSMDGCLTYGNYTPVRISNLLELTSFCIALCREVEGEVEAVESECADALADFWECNSETTTCDLMEGIPLEDDPGGVSLPDIADCAAEAAEALVACEDENIS